MKTREQMMQNYRIRTYPFEGQTRYMPQKRHFGFLWLDMIESGNPLVTTELRSDNIDEDAARAFIDRTIDSALKTQQETKFAKTHKSKIIKL
jgi:hypothetical protein